PARGERFPTGKCRLAVEFDQRAQAIEQQRRTLQEVTVLGLEQRDAFRQRRAQDDRLAVVHPLEQRIGQLDRTDPPALGLDVDRAPGVEEAECGQEIGFEFLLRGLWRARNLAQQRAAMLCDALQIERLRACVGQRPEKLTLAGTGQGAYHPEAVPCRLHGEPRDDMAAVRAVTAVELYGPPSDLVQHMRDRAAALSAAPAIDQRLPFARLLGEYGLQHFRDVARDQRRTEPARLERRGCVHGADPGTLVVVEDRMIARPGNMVLGEFGRATDVDAIGVRGQCVDVNAAARVQYGAHAALAESSGASDGQTLSSIFACAAASGWMRSGWNIESFSANPSNRNGTSAALRARATSA